MKPLLRFEAVTLRRGGRRLFEGLDLRLGPGEALHLTGPNGSGKSSLIRLAAGLLRAEAGGRSHGFRAVGRRARARPRAAAAQSAAVWSSARRHGGTARPGDGGDGACDLAQVPVRCCTRGRPSARRWRGWPRRERRCGCSTSRLNVSMPTGSSGGCLVARHRAAGGAVLAASHGPLGGDCPTGARQMIAALIVATCASDRRGGVASRSAFFASRDAGAVRGRARRAAARADRRRGAMGSPR